LACAWKNIFGRKQSDFGQLQKIQNISKFEKKLLQNVRLDEHYAADISEIKF
jgi:hypothetical protein